ncbi:methyltransferase domain-containing protein [Luethyella okanaganae]|uniref:Methyltransferase domain-containing protein n=1 Tax=Luethyella okanaganae TaxID=69372 RepID=A0ABW1VC68_9MICO
MTLQTLSEWLRCPKCLLDLEATPPLSLRCKTGHSYDVNKRGYLNALRAGSGLIGDSAAMLDARDRVLESGAYAPISDALLSLLPSAPPRRVHDAGCGTGHYLEAALEAAAPDARGLAQDISPSAVSRAVRRSQAIDGLIADTWAPLPLRSGSADIVLSIFAPRNLPELHRILTPVSGRLLAVVPRPEHFREFRDAPGMLAVPEEKAERLIESAGPLFALDARDTAMAKTPVTPELAASLIDMGPSAHHRSAESESSWRSPATVTISVDVLRFRPREV